MARRSTTPLVPVPALALALALPLSYLVMGTAAAPYTLIANVVSHFLVHTGGGTLSQPQVNVQCSASPGLQCRSFAQDNRFIINMYHDGIAENKKSEETEAGVTTENSSDEYLGESVQRLEETLEDNTVKAVFRQPLSKTDRISGASSNDEKYDHERGRASTWDDNISDDTQENSFDLTSHVNVGTDNQEETDGNSQGETYDSNQPDDTNSGRIDEFEDSIEDVPKQFSESNYGDADSKDNDNNIESQNPPNDYDESTNDFQDEGNHSFGATRSS